MDRFNIPVTVLSATMLLSSAGIGLVCWNTPDFYPVPTVTPTPLPTVRIRTVAALSPLPSATPIPPATATPKPQSTPVYDDRSIDDRDMDGDNCSFGNGCLHWICHYEKGEPVGYHRSVGPRALAAHLAQHPDDYRDDRWDDDSSFACRDLPDRAQPDDDPDGE